MMEKLKLIVELAKEFIWPSLILFIVLIFKKRINNLLDHLHSFKVSGAEFNFKQAMETVKKTEKVLEKNNSKKETIDDYLDAEAKQFEETLSLVNFSKGVAMHDIWTQVEDIVFQLGEKNILGCTAASSNITSTSTTLQIINDLEVRGILSQNLTVIYHLLKNIRNEALHVQDKEIPYNVCIDFINKSYHLKKELKNIL